MEIPEVSSGYQVLRGVDAQPLSRDGLAILASLLEAEAGPDDIETFELSWAAGDGHARHRHNIGLAVAVTQGSFTILFGVDGEHPVTANEGDYVLIGAETWHDEKTTDGVEMVGAYIGSLETFDG